MHGQRDVNTTECEEQWDAEWHDQMADDHRFFEDVVFPRFTLKLSHKRGPDVMNRMARLFAGLHTCDDDGDADAQTASNQLQQILTRLTPLVQTHKPSAVTRPVELALRFDMRETDEMRMNELIDAIHAAHTPSASTSTSESTNTTIDLLHQRPQLRRLHSPTYIVDCVAIGDHWGMRYPRSSQEMEWFFTCGSQMRTPLATRVLDHNPETLESCAEMRDFLRWALRVNCGDDNPAGLGSGGVRHLQFIHRDDQYSIPAICSALPHTRSLHTFQLTAFDYVHMADIDQETVAWLGYALFHPDSASSSWRKLFLNALYYLQYDSDTFGPDDTLTMMAKGNNLRVALGLSGDSGKLTDAYFTATIRAGTVIQDEPTDGDAVVEVLQVATKMDVCVTSTDLAQLDEWVFVVSRGYGKAYVLASSIEQIVARAPGQPFLTGLKMSRCEFEETQLSNLLQLADQKLQFVDLEGYLLGVPLTESVGRLEAACPHLESLTLHVESEYPLGLQLPPQLRELWFRFPHQAPPSELWVTKPSIILLRDLVTLRIDAVQAPTDEDIHEYIAPLLRTLPHLQRFVWHDIKTRDNGMEGRIFQSTYEMQRFITRAVLDGIELGRDDVALCRDMAPTHPTMVALESVVQYHHRHGCLHGNRIRAVGRLDHELVKLIGGFVGMQMPRDLWVTGGRTSTQVLASASQ